MPLLFALDQQLIVSSAAPLTSLILVNRETLLQARLLSVTNLGFVRISIAEVVGVPVVKQRDVLFVAMECLPAQSAVWLLHVGHYEDNHTASTTPASMCLMQPSRHLIVPWFKCRGLFERSPSGGAEPSGDGLMDGDSLLRSTYFRAARSGGGTSVRS